MTQPGLFPEEPAPSAQAGHRARMRTRLLRAGPDALLDHEMIEMLLFLALPRRDTKALAHTLLTRFGDFAGVIAAPVDELLGVEGLGEAGAAALKLAQGAALRLSATALRARPVLDNWDRLSAHLNAALAREPTEQFRVLFLDARNQLLAEETQSRGTVNHAPVYPREVARRALTLHATAVILAHNHPSGDATPSRADIAMTTEVKAALTTIGVTLHDHLVVAAGGIQSFRRLGLL